MTQHGRVSEEVPMKTKGWYVLVLLTFLGSQRLHAAQNSPLVETKVKTLVVDPNSQSPVVILETITDKKLLPIWIAGPEARAIAIALENIKIPRPLTHDLIGNILQELDAKLRRVVIAELRNDTYIAFLSVESKGKELQIDSRPSDAIAIALRVKAPIFVSAQVLAKAKAVPIQPDRAEQTQARLGIQVQDLTPELANLLESGQQKGVVVADVLLGGMAMKAGIQRGDIITKANEQSLTSANDLEALIQDMKSPARIKLEVINKGKPTTVVIDLPS
jgi:bifunctional DNase/RNase